MKVIRLSFLGTFLVLLVITACRRGAHDLVIPESNKQVAVKAGDEGFNNPSTGKQSNPPGACNPNAYTITLESRTQVGDNWEWVWSVQNPNPGNGTNGTSQNLSHWGMQFGTCFILSSMVSAAYSGDGVNWTGFTPTYQVDPSQGCMTTPVLKFDFGTAANAKSYYRLVINHEYPVGIAPGYYKSGANTGCCTFNFNGISCGGPVELE